MCSRACVRIALVLLLTGSCLATEGIFRGKVVDPPAGQKIEKDWIFIEGRNHLVRKVEVAHAEIVFGPGVTPSQKGKCGPECLAAGEEVRVTAVQDGRGEWHANRVEILEMAGQRPSNRVARIEAPAKGLKPSI